MFISMQNMTSTGTTGNYNVNTLVLFFLDNMVVDLQIGDEAL